MAPIIISQHAQERMVERGIPEEEVIQQVRKMEGLVTSDRAMKAIPGTLKLVVKRDGDSLKVITVVRQLSRSKRAALAQPAFERKHAKKATAKRRW